MTPILALAGLIAFFGASFFFALAETSLFSLGKWQVRQLEERSPGAGKIVGRLLSTPQDLLATLVLGNSFANAGIVAVMLWLAWRRDWPVGLVMFALLWAVLLGGEAAPKTLAVRAPERWSLRVARPMLFLQKASRPLRRIAQYLTNAVLAAVGPSAPGRCPPAFPTPSTRSCSKPLSSRAPWPPAKRRSFCKSSASTAARLATS